MKIKSTTQGTEQNKTIAHARRMADKKLMSLIIIACILVCWKQTENNKMKQENR